MSTGNQDDGGQRRIMLIDDHALFRAGLRLVLLRSARVNPDIQEAGTVLEALSMLREQRLGPDLLLLDIAMPGIDGLSGLRILGQSCPNSTIAVLSANDDPQMILNARDQGAAGFLSKESDVGTIHQAINDLFDGHQYFPLSTASHLASKDLSPPPQKLTPRQLEVLALMAEGHTNKVIARKLTLSENTVRVHVSAILTYLDVNTRMEAVCTARKLAIIQ